MKTNAKNSQKKLAECKNNSRTEQEINYLRGFHLSKNVDLNRKNHNKI